MKLVFDILWVIMFIISGFYLGVALFSLLSPNEKHPLSYNQKFAIFIPAHNEERVIASLINSLYGQDYPRDKFSIFVIAHNCTDQTAKIASQMGARVLTINDTKCHGKGFVLEYALSQTDNSFDAIVVLDADNIADNRFLTEINLAMTGKYQAVQGYIDTKNPKDSWVSYAYATWYWITNHIIQKGFYNLGIGCKIGGTGFAISRDLAKEIFINCDTLAEDAEYTTRLDLMGIKVGFSQRAVVYDQKPTKFKESVYQRIRWSAGLTQVRKKYMKELIKRGRIPQIMRFLADGLMPVSFFLMGILDFVTVMNVLEVFSFTLSTLWSGPVNLLLLNFMVFGMLFVVIVGLYMDKKLDKAIILNTFGFLFYMLSWLPIGVLGEIKHKKIKWIHTKHKE